ncbi:MAG: tetratricopeptide repeat protein [Poseidonibacter sp.]|uniref:tetratricopeptide repeat protein n=1 Tax=Poseidonibacter sp. TaxID=2321188 RepID=UPI00359D5D55
MIEDLLVPEELLQLDKLLSATELLEDTSFLSIIGSDTLELSEKLFLYLKNEIIELKTFNPNSNNILQEIVELNLQNDFLIINLFEKNDTEIFKNLLFFRDFISDYKMKVIFIINKSEYKSILKTSIDFYNIATFSYLFTTYSIHEIKKPNREDLIKLKEEYKSKIKTLNKKQKVSFLIQIGLKYQEYGEIVSALKYINDAFNIAKKIASEEDIIQVKFILAGLYQQINKLPTSERYLIECKKFYIHKKNIMRYKQVLENLCILYVEWKDTNNALKHCNILYKLAIETNDKNSELISLQNYTYIYTTLENKSKIDEYAKKSFSLAEKQGNFRILANLYQFNANRQMKEQSYDKALDFFNKAVIHYKKSNDIYMINCIYNKIGYVYYRLFDYKKSLRYCKWCYSYYIKNNIQIELLNNLKYLSYNYHALNDFNNAFKIIFQALKLSKSLNSKTETINILIYINQIYTSKKEFTEALKYLDEAFILSKKVSNFSNFDLYTRYSDTYKNMNDITNAKKYYKKAYDSKELNNSDKSDLFELYGEILFKEKNFEDAILFFKDSLKIAKETNDLHRILSVEENLAYTYKKLDNTAMARRFFIEVINKLKIINKDSIKIPKLEKEIKSEI